jgi:hypothetical protein
MSADIAQHDTHPKSTVVTELRRLGLSRLRSLEPPRPAVRDEHAQQGDLVHLDIKKLGRVRRVRHRVHGDRLRRTRGISWEYVHAAIDNHFRLTYAEVLPDETGPTTAAFLRRAVA